MNISKKSLTITSISIVIIVGVLLFFGLQMAEDDSAADRIVNTKLSELVTTIETSPTIDAVDIFKQECTYVQDAAKEISNDGAASDEQRKSAQRYARLCDYVAKSAEFDQLIHRGRSTENVIEYIQEDCDLDEAWQCYDEDKRGEYVVYINENIIEPGEEIRAFYTETECPLALDGGEQVCNTVYNQLAAELTYERSFVRILEAANPKILEMQLAIEKANAEKASEHRDSFIKIVDDFESLNALYVQEFKDIEKNLQTQLGE